MPIINNDSERELNKNKICLTLKPLMETIVSISIADPSIKNNNILIYQQESIQNV